MTILFLMMLAATGESFTQARVLEATSVSKLPRAPHEAVWTKASPKALTVSAQRSVRLNDRDANALLEAPGAGQVTVRVLAAQDQLAVWVEWPDPTCDRLSDDEVNTFADAVALETPVEFGAGRRLPYVGMGDEKAPVRLWQQRATHSGASGATFVAAGFGSLTRAGTFSAAMEYDEPGKRWQAVFVLPRPTQALVPVAVAVWDGARKERGGYKQLSGWSFIKLATPAVDPKYVEEISWGYGPAPVGNTASGKVLAEAVCVVCHQLPGRKNAPVGLAPDLSDIGAIATPGYLRDSLTDPSRVVVHHLHLDRRYDKGEPRDPSGAYAAAAGFSWAIHGDGGTTSRMPSFKTFNEQQILDLVAFLLTLKGG